MTQDHTTLDALLKRRHSCRAFLPDAIPDATIEQIVTTAQRVPSWCNAQPWQVHLTRPAQTEKLRHALFAHAQTAQHSADIPFPKAYTGDYKARRRTCGFALYDAVGIAKGDRDASTKQMMENYRFFDAPHFALITSEADLGPYGLLDCGAFVTAFTLSAEALGVASIPQAAVAGFSPFMRDWFDLPDTRHVVCGISFGLRDDTAPINAFRTERASFDDTVQWHD